MKPSDKKAEKGAISRTLLAYGGENMKNSIYATFCTTIGTVGTLIAGLFGGWDEALTALVIFMAIDFITGLMVAGVFKKSLKTESGSLDSKIGFKGLCKKCTVLLFVLMGHELDIVMGASYIRDGICIAFAANELVSITENAALMGIPLPNVLVNAINILKAKDKKNEEEKKDGKPN